MGIFAARMSGLPPGYAPADYAAVAPKQAPVVEKPWISAPKSATTGGWLTGPPVRKAAPPGTAAAPTAASRWQSATTEEGHTYYYNDTGERTWQKPEDFSEPTTGNANAPADWESIGTSSWQKVSTGAGTVYYYNTDTKESRWEKPAEEELEPPVGLKKITYTGVSEQNGRFKAEIWNKEGTEKEYLGSYNTVDIAAHAYNRRALELGKAQNTIKSNEPKATRQRQPLHRVVEESAPEFEPWLLPQQ